MAAALKRMSGLSARFECAWSVAASTSLPTPLSPVRSTVTSLGATRATTSSTRRSAGLSATMGRRSEASVRSRAFSSRKAARLDAALHREDELVGIERLRDVVERAGLHRRDRDALRAVRRQHHHGHARVLHAERGEHLHAVDVGHREIGEHDVGAVRLEVGDARGAAVGGVHVEPCVAEDGLEREAHRGLVVDDQDARHGRTLHRVARSREHAQDGTFSGSSAHRATAAARRSRSRRTCDP